MVLGLTVCFRGSRKRDVSVLLFLKVVLALTVCFDGAGRVMFANYYF